MEAFSRQAKLLLDTVPPRLMAPGAFLSAGDGPILRRRKNGNGP